MEFSGVEMEGLDIMFWGRSPAPEMAGPERAWLSATCPSLWCFSPRRPARLLSVMCLPLSFMCVLWLGKFQLKVVESSDHPPSFGGSVVLGILGGRKEAEVRKCRPRLDSDVGNQIPHTRRSTQPAPPFFEHPQRLTFLGVGRFREILTNT